ncbi:MAG: GNAT family N-acetyltransferase [Fimbriimonadaceae bacterium]|nr:GNAT family N-acetyltransferase [Fimbriimonadaceae bacterium]
MATQDRVLLPAERDLALRHYESVFGVGTWLFHTAHWGTSESGWAQTFATFDDGDLVSTVDVFVRPVRDEQGGQAIMGGIGSVATAERARRQGHSGRLLEMAIAWMHEVGCDFSFLFTGVHAHYRRYGWKDTPLRERNGRVAESGPAAGGVRLEPMHVPTLIDRMGELYAQDNATRPLTHARSARYLRSGTVALMLKPDRAVFTYPGAADLRTYVVAEFGDDRVSVLEAAGDTEGLAPLGATVREAARERGLSEVNLRLPLDPTYDPLIGALAVDVAEAPCAWMMAREIRWPWERVAALFANPAAHHWPLDDF